MRHFTLSPTVCPRSLIYAFTAYRQSYRPTTVTSRVRLPGDIIFGLRLHQHPESLRTKVVRHGSIKFSPGAVNSLGTPRSAERPGSIISDQPSIRNGQADRMRKGRQRGPKVGGRVKCCMKYFYETRSHGPQDQDFDVILT